MIVLIKAKKLASGLLSLSLLLAGGASVFAGTTWSQSYSVELPGFNGSHNSPSQTKETVGQAGLQMSASEGYNVDVRTVGDSATGAWKRDVIGGTTVGISAPQAVGTSLHLEFSSDLTSPDTNIVYSWRSN